MMVKGSCFSREDTKAIKGVAVVLMLLHHLAGFPDRFPLGFTGFSSVLGPYAAGEFLQSIALTANFCVSLFFFLGGYGLYIRWKSGKFSLANEIIRLYKAYWKVFVIFVPIGILFFAHDSTALNPFCVRFVFERKTHLITGILCDLSGLTANLNGEWWFFKSYLCALFLGKLFCDFLEKNRNFWKEMFAVFVADIMIRSVFPAILNRGVVEWNIYYRELFMISGSSSALFAGIVFAKYDAIRYLKQKICELPCPAVISAAGALVVYWARTFILGAEADIIHCALMIPMLSVVFDRCKITKSVFAYLGKHSNNMWLIHSFYCYYFLEVTRIVYATANVWVDLGVLILLSLVSSIALEWFYRSLGKINNLRGLQK